MYGELRDIIFEQLYRFHVQVSRLEVVLQVGPAALWLPRCTAFLQAPVSCDMAQAVRSVVCTMALWVGCKMVAWWCFKCVCAARLPIQPDLVPGATQPYCCHRPSCLP